MAKDRTHGCNLHMPICASQVACDGANVKQEGGICVQCRIRLAKKAKAPAPLKGANTRITESERRELARDKR